MNHLRKQSMVTLAALLLCLTLISGCDSKNLSNKAVESTPFIDPSHNMTLTFVLPGEQKSGTQKVLSEIERRTKDTLNINLDMVWTGSSYEAYVNKVRTLLGSGSPIDVFCCERPGYGKLSFVEMAQEGMLKDLTGLFQKYAPELSKLYSEKELEFAAVDGKLVAIPPHNPEIFGSSITIMKDLADKYNITDIRTLDEYIKFMDTIKENEQDLIPADFSFEDFLQAYLREYDYIMPDSSQRLVYKRDDAKMKLYALDQTPEFKNIVDTYANLNNNGYLYNSLNNDKFTGSSLYYSQKGINPTIDTVISRSSENSSGEKIYTHPEIVSFILYPEKKVYMENPVGKTNLDGALAFNAKSQNIERALMFLNWINQSQDNYDLFMYGIKDEHYVIKEYPITKEEYVTVPDGVDFMQSPYLYWEAGTIFKNITYEHMKGKAEWLKFLEKNTEYAPHGGFYPDHSPVQQSANNRTYLLNEMDRYLRMDKIDIESVKGTINKLSGSDTDNVVHEVQRQLDIWKGR